MTSVLHVIGRFEGTSGGAQRVLVALANHSARKSPTVVAYAYGDGTGRSMLDQNVDIRTLRLQSGLPVRKVVQLYERVRALLREVEPDVVHIHSPRLGPVVRLACRRARIPALTSLHIDPREHGVFPRIVEAVSLPLGSSTVAVSEAVLSGYNRTEQWLLRRRPISVIPNGAEAVRAIDNQERLRIRSELGIARDSILFINVARLHPQKNQLRLVRAFAELLNSTTPVSADLLLVGSGPLEKDLRAEVAALPNPSSIHILGGRDDVDELLGASDVFVMPSIREGLSIAQLESLSAGLPCVGSDIDTIKEVAPSAIVSVDPLDVLSIARGMATLVGDAAKRGEMSSAAYREFRRHTSAVMCAKYDVAYLGLVATVRGSG